jgi:hypothetical protein
MVKLNILVDVETHIEKELIMVTVKSAQKTAISMDNQLTAI